MKFPVAQVFAIDLRFLELSGLWVLDPFAAPERTLKIKG
jgi:hypothetical protein